jgi:hypothetical protein
MRTIEDVQKEVHATIGFSPEFRAAELGSVGRRATVSIRQGGKRCQYTVVLAISKELAREADWPGESHVVIGVSRNPTIKRIEVRKAPDTAANARSIGKGGRQFFHVRVPYVKDMQQVLPEIQHVADVKIEMVDKERMILDFSGIRASGMPVKKSKVAKPA